MGILNSKERIMDTFLTIEGRRQIANSSLRATYYSFSDMSAIYDMSTIVSSSLSAGGLPFNETYRIALEASNLPQDIIVYETDDSGKINAVRPNVDGLNNNPMSAINGRIFLITGSAREEVIDNDVFASLADGIMSSSMTSFMDQMILSSPDPLDETSKAFTIGVTSSLFNITNDNKDLLTNNLYEADIDQIESLFFDRKLSNVPNFKFLPPINKKISESDSVQIGPYASLQQEEILSYDDIKPELDGLDQMGFAEEIRFVETSRENNLVCQLFEYGTNNLGRLDIIDFGEYTVQELNNDTNVTEDVVKRIFFCGKVYLDSTNTATFVNMFTLVFDIIGVNTIR